MTDSARPPSGFRQRILSASGWTIAGTGFSQVIRFGSNLVMTRLLMPEMFGVMAIATMLMYALAMFSDMGLRQSIVRSRHGNAAGFLNTAWSLQVLRGVLLWAIALAIGLAMALANRMGLFPAASAYASPVLPYVIAVLSFGAVIAGLESTKLFEASRSLSLNRVIQIDLAAQAVGLLCMLAWAAADRSIWALVAGSLGSNIARTALSHLWLKGTANRWHWDLGAVDEIVHFGKWIFLSSILGFLALSGDRLLLGGLVSANSLGVYVIAYLIFNSIQQVLTRVIGDVSFPALSEVARDRPGDLKSSYYRVHFAIAAAAYLCTGILLVAGQPLIRLLYDHRYDQAGWMLEALAVGLLSVPFGVALQCFMALGMPKFHSYMITIQLFVLYVFTPVGFRYFGMEGALWAIVASNFSYLPLLLFYKVKYKLFDLRKELSPLPFIVLGMVVGQCAKLLVDHWTGR